MKLLRGFTVLDLGLHHGTLRRDAACRARRRRDQRSSVRRAATRFAGSPAACRARISKPTTGTSAASPWTIRRRTERKLLHSLIEHADALVINVRPGVEQRLGIDEGTLRRLNPKLVFCFITGFGADGPYANRACL